MKKFLQLGLGVTALALITAFVPASPFPSMAYETRQLHKRQRRYEALDR